MEGNTPLPQVIRKLRSQIHKLERENRALKGELRGRGRTAGPARGEASGGARRWEPVLGAEGPPASWASPASSASTASRASPASTASRASLQGGGAAAAAPREQTDTAMTVRRYPRASPAPAPCSTRSHWAGRNPPSTGVPEGPGRAQPPAPPAAAQLSREEEEGLGKPPAPCVSYSHSSNMKLFQEHVCKCRGKVKAVSFLLPTDMSSFAEKQVSLKSPQNQSTKHLMTITEKDM
ncbi:putative coiled-coil domain-containing protein 195 [Passer montanus]|uniref:putative coiled-coil domain-containing protein 195 n=1 Tax=Passer montanus TaxID=9160 RepID=UPI0019620F29|nr:putative coiled-coil domain-containing protein 195 [Passer montanus]